jgi:hypothetical protein
MIRLGLVELYDRGLKDFAALSPLERDVFVVNDLDIYYEMEGGFEDYLLSGGHEPELCWLADTLRRIGETASAVVLARLRDSPRKEMPPLCDDFHALREKRWEHLERYLAEQGAEIYDGL